MQIYGFNSYGGPEVQEYLEAPEPTPHGTAPEDVVLIRPAAMGVNPGDIKVRSGERQGAFPVKFPMAFGREAAGTVLHAPATTGLTPGQRVFGSCAPGTGALAEVVALTAESATPTPEAVLDAHAATLPTAAGTAWDALHELLQVNPNARRVLILGGGGGVGTFAIQMARHLGLEPTSVASAGKELLVTRLGARWVDYAPDDSPTPTLIDRLHALTDQHGPFDALLDAAGGDTLTQAAPFTTPHAIRSAADPAQARELGGGGVGRRRTKNIYGEIAELVDDGAITPVISNEYPWNNAARAIEDIETGHATGNVIVRP